jgi:CheY-like chemotaxis protein
MDSRGRPWCNSADNAVVKAAAPVTSRVLYVEDNATNVKLMARLMKHRPAIELVIANTGAQGLAIVLATPPRLILLDATLPDMSGEEFVCQLRKGMLDAPPPIVVLSADALPHRLAAFTLLNVEEFVTKPYDVQHLYEIVDSYC